MNMIPVTQWQKDPTIKAIVSATYPGYKKKTVYIRAASKVTLHNLNWDGGSRNEYRAATLTGDSLGTSAPYHVPPPWANKAEGAEINIPQGAVMVQGGTFCGKQSTLYIYVNPDDMPKYLAHHKGA